MNEEITFEFLFLKNIITQYDIFILVVIKNNIFMEILNFVQLFNELTKKLEIKDNKF